MVELSHPGPHTGPNQGANQPETMPNQPLRILCTSTYVKGQEFIWQCAEMGVKPTLLTVEKLRDADWPRDALEDIATMPQDLSIAQILSGAHACPSQADRVTRGATDIRIRAVVLSHPRIGSGSFKTPLSNLMSDGGCDAPDRIPCDHGLA